GDHDQAPPIRPASALSPDTLLCHRVGHLAADLCSDAARPRRFDLRWGAAHPAGTSGLLRHLACGLAGGAVVGSPLHPEACQPFSWLARSIGSATTIRALRSEERRVGKGARAR